MIKSANLLDIGHYGDCLQWELDIYFSYLFYLLLCNVYFHSLDAEKKWCKYHFAICILMLCIREASWYRTKLQAG